MHNWGLKTLFWGTFTIIHNLQQAGQDFEMPWRWEGCFHFSLSANGMQANKWHCDEQTEHRMGPVMDYIL